MRGVIHSRRPRYGEAFAIPDIGPMADGFVGSS